MKISEAKVQLLNLIPENAVLVKRVLGYSTIKSITKVDGRLFQKGKRILKHKGDKETRIDDTWTEINAYEIK